MSPKQGSCLCHKVTYEISAEKPFDFNVCHCINCQKWGGSSFSSNPFFKPDEVTIKGQEYIKDYLDRETKSGTPIVRRFCKECGSSIFVTNDTTEGKKLEWVITDIGTLDDAHTWLPKWESFPEHTTKWVAGINLQK